MQDIMIDFETFGTEPGCVLRSLGAAHFVPHTGEVGKTFYRNFDEQHQLNLGFIKDPSTIAWWKKQSQEAQDQLLVDKVTILDGLTDFIAFFKSADSYTRVWSQGANFDNLLAEHAFKALGLKCPWRFYAVRDTRTAYQIAGLDTKSIKRQGTYHNALDDCLHQIRCVHEACKGFNNV